jgi:hypothetical protein
MFQSPAFILLQLFPREQQHKKVKLSFIDIALCSLPSLRLPLSLARRITHRSAFVGALFLSLARSRRGSGKSCEDFYCLISWVH